MQEKDEGVHFILASFCWKILLSSQGCPFSISKHFSKHQGAQNQQASSAAWCRGGVWRCKSWFCRGRVFGVAVMISFRLQSLMLFAMGCRASYRLQCTELHITEPHSSCRESIMSFTEPLLVRGTTCTQTLRCGDEKLNTASLSKLILGFLSFVPACMGAVINTSPLRTHYLPADHHHSLTYNQMRETHPTRAPHLRRCLVTDFIA